MDLRSYEYWKESLKGTVYEKELLSLKGEELEDAFLGHLEFGTAGMRGKIGLGINRMNTFTVRRSTKGLAEFIKAEGLEEKGVAIAYDSRNFSREFAFETAWLLAENGIKVYIYETLRSVPQLSFTILELGCAAGVVITASHNPSIYNGYKVYGADGGQATPADAAKITGFIDAVDDYINIEVSSDISGKDNITVIGREMDERYYRKVLTVLSHKDALERNAGKLKVVYSPLNGAGNIPVRHMLKEIGISQVYVVPEQELPDGNFPTVSAPNPEMRDCYSLAFELAKEKGANLILVTDPDSDRLGAAALDKNGEWHLLTGNEIGCLLMDHILSGKKVRNGFTVHSVVSTLMADQVAARYGINSVKVLTGFRYIAEQIKLRKDEKFLFGFEESYGFLAGDFVRDKDGVQAAVLLAEAACVYMAKDMSLYDAVQSLYEKYGFYSDEVISVTRPELGGMDKIRAAVMELREHNPFEIDEFPVRQVDDVLKGTVRNILTGEIRDSNLPKSDVMIFMTSGGRVIVRPSGTEPKLKIYVSTKGETREEADKNRELLKKGILELIEPVMNE